MIHVYKQSEPGLWTVGHYDVPHGKWHADSDYDTKDAARNATIRMNGGQVNCPCCADLLAALRGMVSWQGTVQELVPDELWSQVQNAIAKAESVTARPRRPAAEGG